MSDNLNDRSPEGAVRRTAWRTPDKLSDTARRAVQAARKAEPETAAPVIPFWRDVPLDTFRPEPNQRGSWHLPKPEETTFRPEQPAPVEPADLLVPDDQATPVVPLAPATPIDEPADLLPFDEDAPLPIDAAPVIAPAAEAAAPATALILEPDDDESDSGASSFSMSELIALASLAESATGASAPVQPAAQPAAEAAFDPNDAAGYARRQLELLQQQAGGADAGLGAFENTDSGQPTTTDSATGAPAASGVIDPADYARQQVASLQQGGAAYDPAPAAVSASGLTPEESALAARFRDAESRVASLRAQYQGGQIDRAAFEAGLRGAMVLDDARIYWMLGTESNQWYKYENNQWMLDTPPVLRKEAGGDNAFQAGQTVPTQVVTDAWIPARVPVSDPDATLVGTGGIFLEGDQATVPAGAFDPNRTVAASGYSGATVPVGTFNQTIPSSPVASPMASPVAVAQPLDESQPNASADDLYLDAVQRQRQNTARTLAIAAAVIAGVIFLVGAALVLVAVNTYNSIADPYRNQIAALAAYQPQFQTARIQAFDGSLIAELTSQQGGARTNVSLSQMSPDIIHAIVSVENERFFEDPGFDVLAIGRALAQNLAAGEIESGASTITQQIARNLVLEDTTISAERKLQEIVIAAEIARTYDKDFILQLYLNEIYFGNQSYGVEAAAQFYFKHSAQDLNLAEAAMLAGLIQAPARFDPVINRTAAFTRMNEVLAKQAAVGCLQFQHAPYDREEYCVTDAQVRSPQVVLQKAGVESAQYLPRQVQINYPHFVNYVIQQVEQAYGTNELYRRGLTVRTTLVPSLQQTAEAALRQQVSLLSTNGVNTGAVMVTDPVTGAILAMIGSPDFNNENIDGQVNNVFTWQQPGSAIKPVLYTAAFEGVNRGDRIDYLTPATILWDVQTTYTNPDYAPVNYDRRFHGPTPARFALANSYNIPAVKVLATIGLDKFRETAGRMGLEFLPDTTFGLPTALGANEVRLYDMMQAYGTLAYNGNLTPLYAISAITTAEGIDVPLPPRAASTQVVQPQVAFLLQNILSDNAARTPAFGATSELVINGQDGRVAAKTGTSNDNRDLWTMGFSTNFVVGVWIGRHDNAQTVGTSGLAAAPIWNAVMATALRNAAPGTFNPPQGIERRQVCAETGTLYDPANVTLGCRSVREEYFISSAPPAPATAGFVQQASIDTWSGLRANQYCADFTTTGSFLNISDPAAVAWLSTPEGRAYAQSLGLPATSTAISTAECQPGQQNPVVQFTNLSDGQQLVGQTQIQAIVTGPNLQSFRLEVANATAPDSWTTIAGPYNQQQPNGPIGTWDTTTLANGAYRLRIYAQSTNGGFASAMVPVGVNNQPTPTPTVPMPTLVLPTFDANTTLLPFPTNIPQGGQAQSLFPTNTPLGFVPMGGLSVQPPTPTIFQN